MDHILAGLTETKISGFNDAGMNRPHRNLKYPFAVNAGAYDFPSIDFSLGDLGKIPSHRVATLRPMFMQYQRPQIGMPYGRQTEQIMNFPLIPGGRRQQGSQ